MDLLRVSLFQYNIKWEDKNFNLQEITRTIKSYKGKTDLIVLPEMFTTGFSMNSESLAEDMNGDTITQLKKLSLDTQIAICGSFISKDDDKYYNKAFFITPEATYFYDKRHLFRMGEESSHFSNGNHNIIIPYKSWNISIMICYDLRFPVWCRNINNNFDLQIFVANWPVQRQNVWDILLKARALENVSYVAGVNRTGKDGKNLDYKGGSAMIDFKGDRKSVV